MSNCAEVGQRLFGTNRIIPRILRRVWAVVNIIAYDIAILVD